MTVRFIRNRKGAITGYRHQGAWRIVGVGPFRVAIRPW